MRTLHVAALPFPSPQGTQGLIHAMLTALTAHGHDAHLLCYAHGAASETAATYRVHRAPGRGRSLRSGPSLQKLRLDAGLARALPGLVRRLRPDALIAHHVEAAAVALACAGAPVLFVAHTSLASELPTYFPRALTAPLAAAGRRFDRALVQRAAGTLAVSPLLAESLARDAQRSVRALTLPWPVPAPITAAERAEARRTLGLADAAQVLLYAGNLDAYQGLAPMLDGIARLAADRSRLALLLATAAPRALSFARQLTIAPLSDERDRRRAHAAADLALVPRLSPGGVPVKLLDALARGVPVVAQARALAGLPLTRLCDVLPHDDASAWAGAIDRALADLPARARTQEARAYLRQCHAFPWFAADYEAQVAACIAQR